LQDRSLVARFKVPHIRKPSAILQIQRWADGQNGCCQFISYVVQISLEAEVMQVSGYGEKAMLSRLLREETTREAGTGKNNSPAEESKVSKAKEK